MMPRRRFNKISALGLSGFLIAPLYKRTLAGQVNQEKQTYENNVKGIRILGGQWRPHYPFEQIAWVSPPWPSQDYIWLDFPEAIFTNIGLIYLSHVNPPFPVVFPDLPKVPWQDIPGGIKFDRELPNGIIFGGSIIKKAETIVTLNLYIENGSKEPLKDIKLQTCAFLRAITEFGDYSYDNKLVHVPQKGWMKFAEARDSGMKSGRFRLGWRGGPPVCDLPVMITVSNQAQRLVAMTWYDSTNAMVSNRERPCMHADPVFPDLEPGQRADIYGELIFFEGSADDFTTTYINQWK
jgi:hypothetical protein